MTPRPDPNSLLINAAKSRDTNGVIAALRAGGNPNINASGEPLVCYAAGATMAPDDILCRLLEGGADPNRMDEHGCTPLAYAAQSKKNERFAMLLQFGADINFQQVAGVSESVLCLAAMLDVETGGTERTAIVLSYTPDLDTLMMRKNAPLPMTVRAHLEHLMETDAQRAANAITVLETITKHAEIWEVINAGREGRTTPSQEAERQAEARQAFLAKAERAPGVVSRRFKLK